jgi:lycopene cyclase domain-containing protein
VKNLYLILNLGSILVPLLASFHPRLKFYKKWKSLAIAMIITNLLFITWDVYFTKIGVWGFNDSYYLGYSIFGLPIEEWLFFICIPYSCVFMHYALLELFPKLSFSEKCGKWITTVIFLLFTICLIINYNKWYPLVNYSLAIVLLLFVYLKNKTLLFQYYKTFIVMLIPFIIVNGILTGTGIVDEIVWYNNFENMGIRFLTIPIEDITYAFTLILLNLFIVDYLQKKQLL